MCSAGIAGASLRTTDVSDEEGRVLAVNADGVFSPTARHCPAWSRAAMAASSSLSSVAGKEGNPMAAAYSAAKAAVIGVKSIGKDVATRACSWTA